MAPGKYVKVVKFVMDITKDMKTRRKAALNASMVDSTSFHIMFADTDFIIQYANPASIRTLKPVEHLLPIAAEEIAQNITSVADAAQNTTHAASNAQQAANEPSRMASELQRIGSSQAATQKSS